MKGYSTREVSDLVKLPQETIRDYARTGVISSQHEKGKHYRFSFQDIILLRTAKELSESGIGDTHLKRVLLKLKSELPDTRSLTSMSISSEGGEIVIHDKDETFNPETGQVHFDFAISELASDVAILSKQAFHKAEFSDHVVSSDDWFDLGVDLEAVSPEDAPAAYLKAIELDPEHSDAYVNLGRLSQEAGNQKESEEFYLAAIKAEPDNLLAAFNLGTLMEDLGRIDDAIMAYKKADAFADAHYNLARLYELTGNHSLAAMHLQTYNRLNES